MGVQLDYDLDTASSLLNCRGPATPQEHDGMKTRQLRSRSWEATCSTCGNRETGYDKPTAVWNLKRLHYCKTP